MNTEKFYFLGVDGMNLPAILWTPDCAPCMVVQIAHGMTEHIGRYEMLAEKLVRHGIAVAGFDLRGHGENEGDKECASFGEGGWNKCLGDMHLFYLELEKRFAQIPHFMLGFSLGSFLVRDYLNQYEDELKGVAILGTGWQPSLVLSIIMGIVKGEVKKYGFDRSTKLIDTLSFGSYNQKFPEKETEFDWLCSDKKQLALYSEDALCRKHISAGLFYQLLDSMKRTGNLKSYINWKKDIPVLLLSGEQDPVGDFGKGIQKVAMQMNKVGMKDVQVNLLPNARHDIFHEVENGMSDKTEEILRMWLMEKVEG